VDSQSLLSTAVDCKKICLSCFVAPVFSRALRFACVGFLRGQCPANRDGRQGAGLDQPTISVLVVEDYEPFRHFIAAKFQTQPHLRILREVSDGADAVWQAQQLQPDLILLDVGLPTINGIEAARRIKELSPTSKILFVSENRSPDVAEEALHAGGLGYVIKSEALKDLLPAVEAVLQGKRFVSASLREEILGISDMGASEGGAQLKATLICYSLRAHSSRSSWHPSSRRLPLISGTFNSSIPRIAC